MLATQVVLLKHPDDIVYKMNTPQGEAKLKKALYEPLVKALAGNDFCPKSLRDLGALRLELSWAQLLEACTILVGIGAVAPCQIPAALATERCAALNKYLCERAQNGNEIQVLASPVIGGAVAVSRFGKLFLQARAQGRKEAPQWAAHAWRILSAQGQRLVREGKTLQSAEENLAELKRQAQEFHAKQIPLLQALAVI